MKNTFAKLACLIFAVAAVSSCTDKYLQDVNTDKTKPTTIDPNAQLTTGLLQTYGDFSIMDTYRCYISGFTQYFSGGWNVSNYAGAVHADNDMMSRLWDEMYSVGIKNVVDAIYRCEDKPCLNAVLRIQRVYMMSILTDVYGDIPCTEAGLGKISGISNPKYDTQEEIYDWFFTELDECIGNILKATAKELITGDVTSLNGSPAAWAKYANSLRMRYAMRISDVKPQKAKEEFEKALACDAGYISLPSEDAYTIFIDGPFTLYDGARDLDFRVNAWSEMCYGQDPTSPTFVCHTLFHRMKKTNDPRLYRICRHYLNTKRAENKADEEWNIDVTDEVIAYQQSEKGQSAQQKQAPGWACYVGAAWYSDWVNAPDKDDVPTFKALCEQYPEAGFDGNNYPARMIRPFLSMDFEKGENPGILMTSAETHFLLAEAALKGWSVDGTVEEHYKAGITDAMHLLNTHYLPSQRAISEIELRDYLDANPIAGTAEQQKEAINTQAWILHLTNPSEGWANMRRSDYPVMDDRTAYDIKDFAPDDMTKMETPLRLKYPALEKMYNSEEYDAAVSRIKGGTDDWHQPVWWDKYPTNVDHSIYME